MIAENKSIDDVAFCGEDSPLKGLLGDITSNVNFPILTLEAKFSIYMGIRPELLEHPAALVYLAVSGLYDLYKARSFFVALACFPAFIFSYRRVDNFWHRYVTIHIEKNGDSIPFSYTCFERDVILGFIDTKENKR